MARAAFVWENENIAHVARHGLTPAEVEPIVNNPRNVVSFSEASGRPCVFGTTKAGQYIVVIYDHVKDKPWTVRVTTAYPVPRPKRR